MPKVLIQAGHLPPLEPGISGTGAAGEVEMVKAIRDALITLLRADPRFEATPAGGDLPNGKKVDAALFLHCDGAQPSARGFSLSYPLAGPRHRKLADRIRAEYLKLPDHPPMRRDNPTVDSSKYYGYRKLVCGSMCLIEHGFISNATDRAWMKSHVKAIARAEYRGLCAHFGLVPALGESNGTAKVIAIQARHRAPVEPGQSAGAAGSGPLEARVQDAFVTRLKRDGRFNPVALGGDLPDRVVCDLGVVLSTDWAERPDARGYYFAYPDHAANQRLANLLDDEVGKLPNRPPRRQDNNPAKLRDYSGFKRLATPEGEVLFQMGFLSNAADQAWLDGGDERLAGACYRAVCRYFALAPKA